MQHDGDSGDHPEERIEDTERARLRTGGDAARTSEVPDHPLSYEEQRKRFGGADAAADAHLGEATDSSTQERRRLTAQEAHARAERQLALMDDTHIDAAADELRKIDWLQPEQWRKLDRYQREAALQEANRALGRAFNRGALPLEFRNLDNEKALGLTTHDGAYTYIHEKFLDPQDSPFGRHDHPSWAVGTVAHEYRHSYQQEEGHTTHGPLRSDVPEEIAFTWDREWEDSRGKDLEVDADSVASRLCRKLYGAESQYR